MCSKCLHESPTTLVQLASCYCSGRFDTGGNLSEVPSLPSTGATSTNSAQGGTSADEPEEPEHLNVDDFFVMKASSECKFIIIVVTMIRFFTKIVIGH